MAQNNDKILDFGNFCKEVQDFVEYDVENCVVEFFIDMLWLYLQKHMSIKKRTEFFTNHSLTWQNNFLLCCKNIIIKSII